jgi:hypothetical protein
MLLSVSSHPGNQLRSEQGPFSPVELSEGGLQHDAKLRELTLPLVKQSHCFADHSFRIGELTAGNLFPNPGFDVGGKLHCHHTGLSGLAAFASITLR